MLISLQSYLGQDILSSVRILPPGKLDLDRQKLTLTWPSCLSAQELDQQKLSAKPGCPLRSPERPGQNSNIAAHPLLMAA